MNGEKYDGAKPDLALLPVQPLISVGEVLTYGAKKYEENNWRKVPDAHHRYMSAALRHLLARLDGEVNDEESGLPHLAHAACCMLFCLWFDNKKGSPKAP